MAQILFRLHVWKTSDLLKHEFKYDCIKHNANIYDEKENKMLKNCLEKNVKKQIDKVTANTIDMHASIKGIAGNAIQSVKALELGGIDEANLLED